ncbi:Phenyllactate dehydrogenase [compost metagenome]
MKDGAILINTARGSLLNYNDLEEALRIGKLYGAGLDVYSDEPILYSQLCELNNVVCTPHVAYYTNETIARMNRNVILQAIEYYLNSTKLSLKALN